MFLRTVKKVFQRYPLASNCVAYASFSASAELIIQHFEIRNAVRKEYDIKALGRYAIVGGLIIGPSLYGWYHLVDKVLPGVSKQVVAIKTVADVICVGIPYYCAFYGGISFLEGSSFDVIKQELRVKFLPTYIASTVFWMPGQALNFYFLPTRYRVAYVGFLTFCEDIALCVLKRTSNEKFQQFVPSWIK